MQYRERAKKSGVTSRLTSVMLRQSDNHTVEEVRHNVNTISQP